MADLRKYGVATHFYKPIIKRAVVDFAVSADWTPAAGDVKLSKDGGAAANVTNLPTAITMGNTAMWDFSMTATEMQAAKVNITVADSATKAVEDTMIECKTYGNASAEHAVDLDDSVRAGLTALPNAAAEAAGGLYTRGAGAGQINQNANGQVDSRTVAMAADVVTAAAVANGAIDAATFAAGAIDAAAIANGAIDAATFAAGAIDAAAIAADAIGSSELAATAVTEIRDAILSDATPFAGGSIALIKAKTDNLPVDPADESLLEAAIATRAVAGDAMTLTVGERAAVADKLLGRTRAGGADGGRTVAECLAFGRNKWAIAAGTLTVYADDDVTPLFTAAVTTAAGDPVTSVDPV
jgi:hypothetical protein